MQSLSNLQRHLALLRRLPVLRPQVHLAADIVVPLPAADIVDPLPAAGQWPPQMSFSVQPRRPLGNNHASTVFQTALQKWGHGPLSSPTLRSFYSSEANTDADGSAVVEELYQKMLKSVEARTMPPNAWLWSLIGNCSSREDINLLFQILQKLRVFRLSNLRIMDNFNDHLCMKVSEACARANAIDYGMKALWKHNVYGLTPSIASAHYLLLHAKKNNDVKLMERIMRLLRRNSLPLQPGTADIVFSTCYNANNWDLISKFSKLFLKAGVKLRPTTFDVWMEFAAKIGDAQSIWKIQKLRAKSTQKLTLASAFSCAKGYLIEHNPKSAAAIIHLLYEELPDKKKPGIKDELQKLISRWPEELMKMQKEEDTEALAETLRTDISSMVASLMDLGMAVELNTKELTS